MFEGMENERDEQDVGNEIEESKEGPEDMPSSPIKRNVSWVETKTRMNRLNLLHQNHHRRWRKCHCRRLERIKTTRNQLYSPQQSHPILGEQTIPQTITEKE